MDGIRDTIIGVTDRLRVTAASAASAGAVTVVREPGAGPDMTIVTGMEADRSRSALLT